MAEVRGSSSGSSRGREDKAANAAATLGGEGELTGAAAEATGAAIEAARGLAAGTAAQAEGAAYDV